MRIDGKVAIVTGGANGIGRATALLFSREGARVVVADRDTTAGRECADLIRSEDGKAVFIETDVGSPDDVAHLVEAALGSFGGIDILVSCAGIALRGNVVETEPERWNRVLDINLSSIYHCCRSAIPHMTARGGGAIVNIASVQGMRGWPCYAAYAASKAGIIGLTCQIAVEYAAVGIRSNSVSPGGVTTHLGENTVRLEPDFTLNPGEPAVPPLMDGAQPSAPDQSSATLEQPRLHGPARPEDIAYAALFLASDESAHVTGHNLVVDGGASVRGAP